MENLKKTKFEISSVVKHNNDWGYADHLFVKFWVIMVMEKMVAFVTI